MIVANGKINKSNQSCLRPQNQEEAKEAEQSRMELGLDKDDSLKAMILKRHQSREQQTDDFFSHLEQKYAKLDAAEQSTKKKGKKNEQSTKKKGKKK